MTEFTGEYIANTKTGALSEAIKMIDAIVSSGRIDMHSGCYLMEKEELEMIKCMIENALPVITGSNDELDTVSWRSIFDEWA